MSDRFRYSYFSVVFANGWDARIRDPEGYPSIAIAPFDNDVQLCLSPKTLALDGQHWVQHIADLNRKNRRVVFPVECGEFSGYVVPWKIRNLWGQSWALHSRGAAIEAMYHCEEELRGRDDYAVSDILASLRYEPEACDS